MNNFVKDVKLFNEIAGTKEEFNARKVAMYTGLVLEEVAEMLESYNTVFLQELIDKIVEASDEFKRGDVDSYTEKMDRVGFLDAAVDIAVVSLGAGISVGSDIEGACNEVTSSNLSKFPVIDGVRTILKDKNGKVRKPEGWTGPKLTQYLKK